MCLFVSEYSFQGGGAQVAQGGQNIPRGAAAPPAPLLPEPSLCFNDIMICPYTVIKTVFMYFWV